MNRPITVFTDSDVVISSLISTSGAANLLLNNSQVKNIISDVSVKEQNKKVPMCKATALRE